MRFIIVKSKLASLPENVNWFHMLGASILGGVGFTMAIFVANLAFPDEGLVATAKLGILAASLLAGVLGFVLLLLQATEEMLSQHARKPLITMSMGDLGMVTRICGGFFGSAVTFGSAAQASAPGQLPSEHLRTLLSLMPFPS